MKWERIKGFPNYRINENGDVYSIKYDKFLKPYVNPSGVLYIQLSNKGAVLQTQLSTLVLDTFKPSRTQIKLYAWHLDLELDNCANNNLERCTRSDRKRMFNEMKKKKRGVYTWTTGKLDKHGNPYTRYRVMFKDRSGKTRTFAYAKTEFYARFLYVKFYMKEFGRLPY